jgi:raffinose/stachyose/melibiose transport system substrate-binding protein
MDRRRHGPIAVLAAVLAAALIPASAVQGQDEEAKPYEGVVLSIWRKHYDNAGLEAVNSAFSAETGATLDVRVVPPPGSANFLPQWAAGERPDVLFVEGWANTMNQFDVVKNMNPVDDLPFVANIPPGLESVGVVDGVRYWAPVTAPTINGFTYNKAVADELGIEQMPSNLEQLKAFCGEVSAAGKIPIVIGQADLFMAWAILLAMSSDFLVANPTFADDINAGRADFTDPGFVARIQSIVDLKEADCFEEGAEAVGFADAMAKYMNDEGVIFACGNFCVPDLIGAYGAEAVNEKIRFLPISYEEPVVYLYGTDDWGAYLPKTGDPVREAAARAYVEYLTGPGYTTYLEKMREPSRYPSAYPVPDPSALTVPVQESFEAAESLPTVAMLDPALVCGPSPSETFTFLSELFVGDKTAEDVAQDMTTTNHATCADLGIEQAG